jgi:hypothetical protein
MGAGGSPAGNRLAWPSRLIVRDRTTLAEPFSTPAFPVTVAGTTESGSMRCRSGRINANSDDSEALQEIDLDVRKIDLDFLGF